MDYRLTVRISLSTVLASLAVSSSCIIAIYLCGKECTILLKIFERLNITQLFNKFSSHMSIPFPHIDEIDQTTHIYVCLEYVCFCKTSLYYINTKLYDMSPMIIKLCCSNQGELVVGPKPPQPMLQLTGRYGTTRG